MPRCAQCRSELPATATSCPACGTLHEADPDQTVEVSPPRRVHSDRSPRSSGPSFSRPASETSRFAPGQVLGERYRIVSLLGRGGMGEVYRADDLRLEESVALKFLPSSLAEDPISLRRLQGEVRVTRQVTHANVCRVHDLVEVEGETCISMEYIDGEDLASLLRRIGRLPQDKGVEIARQLCAGLASAHSRGVLHRDLKPANVMIDGRGRVKINDFGIAALVELAADDENFSGTPVYMAPEVVRGEAATPRSDIYSLGLVLFELFTGRRAIDADSFSAIRRWHESGPPDPISDSAELLGPEVADAVRRCLDPEPERRPSSALLVSSMLPGGDPLLEALAAGETPSPELIAAAGEAGTITRRSRWLLVGATFLGLGLVSFFDRDARLTEIAPMEHTPDALEFIARTFVHDLGHDDPPLDSARGFYRRGSLVQFIDENDVSADRWERLHLSAAGVVQFWYRQSTERFVPTARFGGRVWETDPPQTSPGMITLVLTAAGKLVRFSAVPSPEIREEVFVRTVDWNGVLGFCGFDATRLVEEKPQQYPPVPFDDFRAWTGPLSGIEGVTSHIEVAAWRGRVVHVRVRDEWTVSQRRGEGRIPGKFLSTIDDPATLILFLIPLFAGAWFGIANLRAGRSDRAGAFRVGVVFVILNTAVWVIRAHHVGSLEDEKRLLVRMLSEAFFMAVFAWFLYLAIEPTIRRHWPLKLVSWTRLLRGRSGDPLVGRDLLVGIVCGVGMACLSRAHWIVAAVGAATPPAPLGMNFSILDSPRQAIGQVLALMTESTFTAIVALFLLVLCLLLVRKKWAAYALIFVLGILRIPYDTATESLTLDLAFRALAIAVLMIALDRSLLSMLGALFVYSLLREMVITLDPNAWYLTQGIVAVAVIGGTALLLGRCACRPSPSRPRSRTNALSSTARSSG